MYPKKIYLLVILLFIGLGSVYYYSGNTTSEKEEQQASSADSLVADDRPSYTARRDTVPEPVGENLAPGTALLRTTIIAIQKEENKISKIAVRVDEILGYGSSTPPISSGTEFLFDVSYYLEQNPQFREQIKSKDEIKVLVSYQEGMRLNESDKKQSWSLVELQENE